METKMSDFLVKYSRLYNNLLLLLFNLIWFDFSSDIIKMPLNVYRLHHWNCFLAATCTFKLKTQSLFCPVFVLVTRFSACCFIVKLFKFFRTRFVSLQTRRQQKKKVFRRRKPVLLSFTNTINLNNSMPSYLKKDSSNHWNF